MAASKQARAKDWGREVENAALRKLRIIFPNLRRIGSVGYVKDHPDLIQDGEEFAGETGENINLVVTRDKRGPLLVTMTVDDLLYLAYDDNKYDSVFVQVKGRQTTWIGGLYAGLTAASAAYRKSRG